MEEAKDSLTEGGMGGEQGSKAQGAAMLILPGK